MTNTIYAYYAEVGCTPQGDLIDLWIERWQQEGWKAVVLGEDLAKQDPRYEAMMRKAEEFPCVNHRGFERTNFERWLAFSTVNGAVTDYDVFPTKPFPPRRFDGFVCGDVIGGPGFMVGTAADFSRIADLILAYEVCPDDQFQGIPHIGDMTILQRQQTVKSIYDAVNVCVQCFKHAGWEDMPLTHFGNASIADVVKEHEGLTKGQVVLLLLQAIYPK